MLAKVLSCREEVAELGWMTDAIDSDAALAERIAVKRGALCHETQRLPETRGLERGQRSGGQRAEHACRAGRRRAERHSLDLLG